MSSLYSTPHLMGMLREEYYAKVTITFLIGWKWVVKSLKARGAILILS